MRKIMCTVCNKPFHENDCDPNVHYSTPETICPHCKRVRDAAPGTVLQRADGTYYTKQ